MNLCDKIQISTDFGGIMDEPYIVKDNDYSLRYRHLLYKNPPCDAYSRHSHNLYEILYFLSGDATHIIEGKKYKLKKGDLIIVHPSKYHFIKIDSSTDYERHNILFDHKMLGINMKMLSDELDVVNIKQNSIIDDIFKKLDYYSQKFSNDDFFNIAKLLIQEMIYNLTLVQPDKSAESFSVINPLLSKALAYIGENLFTIKNISEVAQAVFVTESYLFRLFKKELLQSPKKYINEKRLLYAQNQIKKGRSPSSVASTVGFDDYTTFYRNYISFFGHSPSSEINNA
jgi:AraC-like DNA-binding protein